MIREEWKQIVTTLAESIREVRTLVGWSQQELADRAVVSQGTISRMESGEHDNTPFHSVVVVLRTLGTAAIGLDLTVTPLTRSLLTFTEKITRNVELVEPDSDVAAIVRMFGQMTPRQRTAFMRFVRSAAALVAEYQEVA